MLSAESFDSEGRLDPSKRTQRRYQGAGVVIKDNGILDNGPCNVGAQGHGRSPAAERLKSEMFPGDSWFESRGETH
jgi:hypothetical protein